MRALTFSTSSAGMHGSARMVTCPARDSFGHVPGTWQRRTSRDGARDGQREFGVDDHVTRGTSRDSEDHVTDT